MARANLNKSKKVLTSTTTVPQHQSTYPRGPDSGPESASIEITPVSDPNLLSKITSKCEHCETRFT